MMEDTIKGLYDILTRFQLETEGKEVKENRNRLLKHCVHLRKAIVTLEKNQREKGIQEKLF